MKLWCILLSCVAIAVPGWLGLTLAATGLFGVLALIAVDIATGE
jgi:hypothetical protein